jgi:hypothetical protein
MRKERACARQVVELHLLSPRADTLRNHSFATNTGLVERFLNGIAENGGAADFGNRC